MVQSQINIVDDYESLCEKVVQEIMALAMKTLTAQDKFSIVLSGGSTPKGIYQCMAGPSYRNKFQWDRIHFFWGDERWVAPEDQRSNYHMVSEALLTKVKIPSANIHPIPTKDCDLQASARLYEETIGSFFKLKKNEFPHFDLILLGIGQDGHTSSLFPGNPALLVKDRMVVPVSQQGIPEKRITLTLPAINHAKMIFFLISGLEKAAIVHDVFGKEQGAVFPAGEIKPYQGNMCLFLDKAAASKWEA